MSKKIEVTLGSEDFEFEVTNDAFNKFINSSSGGRGVQAGFNLLSSTVEQKQRAKFLNIITDAEKKPKGMLVMELVGVISEDFNDELPNVVKKRKPTQDYAELTDTID